MWKKKIDPYFMVINNINLDILNTSISEDLLHCIIYCSWMCLLTYLETFIILNSVVFLEVYRWIKFR